MGAFFGTDGIRGRVGHTPVTPEGFLQLGWALGTLLQRDSGKASVVLGRDTRLSGQTLHMAFSAGVLATGTDVKDVQVMTTPGVACLTRSLGAQAGVVISASHNKYYDNGVKFFDQEGFKLTSAVEASLEHLYNQPLEIVKAPGTIEVVEDAPRRYLEFLKNTLASPLDLHGLTLVIDAANGAGHDVAPILLEELGATVHCIGCEPDGLNINEDCGATHTQWLAREVLSHRADMGIALDGDGDRLIMVDHTGEVLDGDELLFILAKFAHERGTLKGGVVGTLMSNLGQEQALNAMGIPFERSAVGDSHVLAKLKSHDWMLGGESSGHIISLGKSTTGDGLLSAIQILSVVCQTGEKLHALKQAMHKFPQILRNVPTYAGKAVMELPQVKAACDAARARLGDKGRLLLRPSGTEPVVRIMVEGEQASMIESLAEELAQTLTAASSTLDK